MQNIRTINALISFLTLLRGLSIQYSLYQAKPHNEITKALIVLFTGLNSKALWSLAAADALRGAAFWWHIGHNIILLFSLEWLHKELEDADQ